MKRVDHRHHALDAIIIAATSRAHIKYLSSLSAVSDDKYLSSIRQKLAKTKVRDFELPWESFVKDTKIALESMIISHKINDKLISKPKNKYKKYVLEDGKWKKKFVKQEDNEKWLAVRRSMFKQPFGKIWIKETKEIKIMDAVEIYLMRNVNGAKDENGKPLDYVYDKDDRQIIKKAIQTYGNDFKAMKKYFKHEKISKARVAKFNEYASKRVAISKDIKPDKMPYAHKSQLAETMNEHLAFYENKSTQAFEGEGLIALQKKLNNKIKKITFFQTIGKKEEFNGGLYETDKGSNVFYCIYEDLITKERNTKVHKNETISILEVVKRVHDKKPITPTYEGYKTIALRPDDLVYVATEEEYQDRSLIDLTDKSKIFSRIYKMVKSTGRECYFIQHNISIVLLNKTEYESQNCMQKTIDEEDPQKIVDYCIKLKVDRLGNIELDDE